MPPKAIRINAQGHVVALDNPVPVSKKNNDELLWIALGGGGPWTITFDKIPNLPPPANADPSNYPLAPLSPFPGGSFTVPAGGASPSTGAVIGLVGRTYRYQVRQGANAPNGQVMHDPDVDVES